MVVVTVIISGRILRDVRDITDDISGFIRIVPSLPWLFFTAPVSVCFAGSLVEEDGDLEMRLFHGWVFGVVSLLAFVIVLGAFYALGLNITGPRTFAVLIAALLGVIAALAISDGENGSLGRLTYIYGFTLILLLSFVRDIRGGLRAVNEPWAQWLGFVWVAGYIVVFLHYQLRERGHCTRCGGGGAAYAGYQTRVGGSLADVYTRCAKCGGTGKSPSGTLCTLGLIIFYPLVLLGIYQAVTNFLLLSQSATQSSLF